ncbi:MULTISPECIES: hypothetical protein [Pseudomonas]|uniref:Delta-60 repeat domain-containing protein n=1 Tax=Pseudomonas pudica TaxID=272772 RepID=A0ABS0G2L4_9PSED|nr:MULTISPECIES: hypothetical protein [Pseudomonas]MBF8646787.1 hypothetical protein [Pseudomonas pudica]MBF8762205.1 hypothetical protein [Pseudomonas pudica]MDZ5111990.1 hypothetical protein [Pseudomonas putida]RFQ01259.1 hypothetical protein D0O09_16115 [Pseudomonas putida]
MSNNPALWTRIDLPLPEDDTSEIARPPYLVGGFYYSSKNSEAAPGEPTMVLTKLTPDGAAVEAFGEHGTVRIRMPSEQASWLCFVENGDHLVCGVALRATQHFALFRLNKTSGKLDQAFGDGGFKLEPYPKDEVVFPLHKGTSPCHETYQEDTAGYAGSVPQFADGKLRQAVNSGLAQFDLQGNLDKSFNSTGMRRFFTWQNQPLFTLAVVARYAGEDHAGFYYCGMHRVGNKDVQAWVGACDKNGAVVPGFAQEGVWIVNRLPGHPDIAHVSVYSAVQAHDCLYLVGNAGSGTGDSGFVLRLKLDGSVDPSFNDGQAVIFKRPEFDRTKAFAVTPHDSGILIGCAHTFQANDQLPTAIVRLDANGKVDSSFGDNGWLLTPAYPESKTLLTFASGGQQIIELRGEKFLARYPL